MNYDYTGEKFIDRIFRDIYLSDEVQHTSLKSDRREETIRKYMERLERVHEKARKAGRINLIKNLYYDKYVIKKENIPNVYNEEQKQVIIDNQKKSLGGWIDYLTDENTMYPMWLKYWAFQGMRKLGTHDDARDVYQRRSDKTLEPFVDANPAIIADCIENMYEFEKNKRIGADEIKTPLQSGSFKKLYEYYEKKFKESRIYIADPNDGVWIKYNQGSMEDAQKLYKSLQGKAVPWCTRNESTAINQVCGGGGYADGGDFYVYYTSDENKEYTMPRIAIRMSGKTNIAEIRGIVEHQCLEPELIDVLELKLKEMDFVAEKDIKKNLETVNELKRLSEINKKTINAIDLSEEEIISLYTNHFGFGWAQDPLAEKTLKLRYFTKDVNSLNNNNQIKIITDDRTRIPEYYSILKKEVLLEVIKLDSTLLRYASPELRKDKEVVMAAVSKNGVSLIYASPELIKDKEVVMAAVLQYGRILSYASEELRKDKEVVMAAVSKDGMSLQYASEELRKDKEVVMAAVSKDGRALQYASPELRKDKEFLLSFGPKNGVSIDSIISVNREFQNDKSFQRKYLYYELREKVKKEIEKSKNMKKQINISKEFKKRQRIEKLKMMKGYIPNNVPFHNHEITDEENKKGL